MTEDFFHMTSHRPYLLRALVEWINDNQLTPHILVDAGVPGVQVRLRRSRMAGSCSTSPNAPSCG
jgi:stringent starvation protein B